MIYLCIYLGKADSGGWAGEDPGGAGVPAGQHEDQRQQTRGTGHCLKVW